jgi:hypothetical protein
VSTKLAHQTQKTAGIPNGLRTATVTAVNGSAVTISVAGGSFTSGVGVLASYAPSVGDVVAVFRQDSAWLVLGSVPLVGATRRVGTTPAIVDGGATSGTTELVVNTVTVNVVEGQRYHVKSYFPYVVSVANERYLIRLREGVTTAGAQITYDTAYGNPSAVVLVAKPESDWIAPTTGEQQFCVTAQGQGTIIGTLTPKGAASQTRFLIVDLIAD